MFINNSEIIYYIKMIRTKKKINGKSNCKSKRYGKSKKKIMKGGAYPKSMNPVGTLKNTKKNKGPGTIGSLGLSVKKLQNKYRSKSGLFGNGKGVFSSEALESANPAITPTLTLTRTSTPTSVPLSVTHRSAQPNAYSTLSSFPRSSYSFVNKRTPAPPAPSVSQEFKNLMVPLKLNLGLNKTPYYSLGTANTVEYAEPVVSTKSGYQKVSPDANAEITSFLQTLTEKRTNAAKTSQPTVPKKRVPGYFDPRETPTINPAMEKLQTVLAARRNAGN
jgi:hypothetical protein